MSWMDRFERENLEEYNRDYVDLVVQIKPQAKQSARFSGKNATRVYTDPAKKRYQDQVRKQVSRQFTEKPYEGLLILQVIFSTSLKSFTQVELPWAFHKGRFDTDNLMKPLKDAMEGICYSNDSQVVETHARKVKSKQNIILIRLREIPNYQ